VQLGAAIVCTADNAADDPVFNADTSGTFAVNSSAPNVITSTGTMLLVSTGCAAGNTLHYQIKRLRYNANDSYEGYVQVLGSNLQIGILQ